MTITRECPYIQKITLFRHKLWGLPYVSLGYTLNLHYNRLLFEGIAPDQTSLSCSSEDLAITNTAGMGGTIRIEDRFINPANVIDNILFQDSGTIWNLPDMASKL